MQIIDFILAALAVRRLTYLVVHEDGPFDMAVNLREATVDRLGPEHWITQGINCPFCVSFWLALTALFIPKRAVRWLALAEVARIMEVVEAKYGN